MKVQEPKTKEEKIEALRKMKEELFNKYGLYGGGPRVTKAHNQIDSQLDILKN